MIPASIMPLAAPFDLSGAAFALRPSFASIARDLGWCEYDYPRWGEHFAMDKRNFLRARRTGFSHRVGAPIATGLRPFALASLCPAPMP
jgi:hypothetical protein